MVYQQILFHQQLFHLIPLAVTCVSIDKAGTFALVRHLPANSPRWHRSTYVACESFFSEVLYDFIRDEICYSRCFRDRLAGTAVYGTYQSSTEFSVDYSAYVTPTLRMMFATGNTAYWLVVRYDQIVFNTDNVYRPLAMSTATLDSSGRPNLGLGISSVGWSYVLCLCSDVYGGSCCGLPFSSW